MPQSRYKKWNEYGAVDWNQYDPGLAGTDERAADAAWNMPDAAGIDERAADGDWSMEQPLGPQARSQFQNTLDLFRTDSPKFQPIDSNPTVVEPPPPPTPQPAPEPSGGFWNGLKDTFSRAKDTVFGAGQTMANDATQLGNAAGRAVDQTENAFRGFTDQAAKAQRDSVLTRGYATPNLENKNLWDTAGASMRAGVGDTMKSVGNTLEWQSHGAGDVAEFFGLPNVANDVRQGYINSSKQFKNAAEANITGFETKPPDHEFTWSDMLDPQYYATTIARAVPTSSALMSIGMGGSGLMGTLSLVRNASPFVRHLLTAAGAGTFSGAVEAAMESGNVYEQARSRGMSPEQAKSAADQNFMQQWAMLSATNALEFGTAFLPKGISNALDTGIGKAARFGASALQEGGEEVAQEAISRNALGDPVKWDANMKEQFSVGALMGAGFGAAGMIANKLESLERRVTNKLDDQTRAEFNDILDQGKAAGVPQEQAVRQALDQLAEHPQGQALINEALQEEMQSAQTAQQAVAPTNVSNDVMQPAAFKEPVNVTGDLSQASTSDAVQNTAVTKLHEGDVTDAVIKQLSGESGGGEVVYRSPEYDQEIAVVDQYNRLKEQMGNRAPAIPGNVTRDQEGNVTGRYGSISQAPEWLQDFRKENKRLPNQQELGQLARKHVTEGYRDGGIVVPPLQQQQIQDELDHITQLYEQTQDPSEREGLMETAQQLMDSLAELQNPTPAAENNPAPAAPKTGEYAEGDRIVLKGKPNLEWTITGPGHSADTFRIQTDKGGTTTIHRQAIQSRVSEITPLTPEAQAQSDIEATYKKMRENYVVDAGKWKPETKVKRLQEIKDYANQHGLEFHDHYQRYLDQFVQDSQEYKTRQRKSKDESWQDAGKRLTAQELHWELEKHTTTELRQLQDSLGMPKGGAHKNVIISRIADHLGNEADQAKRAETATFKPGARYRYHGEEVEVLSPENEHGDVKIKFIDGSTPNLADTVGGESLRPLSEKKRERTWQQKVEELSSDELRAALNTQDLEQLKGIINEYKISGGSKLGTKKQAYVDFLHHNLRRMEGLEQRNVQEKEINVEQEIQKQLDKIEKNFTSNQTFRIKDQITRFELRNKPLRVDDVYKNKISMPDGEDRGFAIVYFTNVDENTTGALSIDYTGKVHPDDVSGQTRSSLKHVVHLDWDGRKMTFIPAADNTGLSHNEKVKNNHAQKLRDAMQKVKDKRNGVQPAAQASLDDLEDVAQALNESKPAEDKPKVIYKKGDFAYYRDTLYYVDSILNKGYPAEIAMLQSVDPTNRPSKGMGTIAFTREMDGKLEKGQWYQNAEGDIGELTEFHTDKGGMPRATLTLADENATVTAALDELQAADRPDNVDRFEVAPTENGYVVRVKERLQGKEYEKLSGQLRAIGGAWDSKAKGFLFSDDPSDQLNDLDAAAKAAMKEQRSAAKEEKQVSNETAMYREKRYPFTQGNQAEGFSQEEYDALQAGDTVIISIPSTYRNGYIQVPVEVIGESGYAKTIKYYHPTKELQYSEDYPDTLYHDDVVRVEKQKAYGEPAAPRKFELLHFALSPNKDEVEAIKQAKPKAVMLSYARWGSMGKIKSFVDSLGYRPIVMVDNGAFSNKDVGLWDVMDFFINEWETSPHNAWNQIKGAQIEEMDGEASVSEMFPDFVKFTNWLESNKDAMDYVIAPDDLQGDITDRQEKAVYAYQFFKNGGFKFIPVFHYGADTKYLAELLDEGADYIALGGSVGVDENERAAWAKEIVAAHPDIKFHLLGTNNQRLIDKIPGLYSADGGRWRSASMLEGDAKTPDERANAGAAEIQKREEKVAARKDDTYEPKTSNGITIQRNKEKEGVEISFTQKPTGEVLKQLHDEKFRWSGKQKLWYAKYTPGRWALLERLQNPSGTLIDSTDSNKMESTNPAAAATFDQQLANKLKAMIHQGQEMKSADLFKAADDVFKGTQAQGRYTPKDAYDALELAVNQYLLEQMEFNPPTMDLTARGTAAVRDNVEKLAALTKLLPTQTKRTEDQEKFQQFSTPPAIAYVASWVANINANDTVLEPSAGIGGMAVFGKANGAQVVVNELDPRRLEIIKQMPFDRFFKEDGEQINNILPKDVKPTVVIMNPPFSTSATRGVTDTKNSFNHVEQALKRLEPGGRLVAVLGQGRDGVNSKMFNEWLKKLGATYNVRASLGIDGKNYTKYGTSFNVQYVVIDKTAPTAETLIDRADTLDQAIEKLEGIANDKQSTAARDQSSQPRTGQSTGVQNPSQDTTKTGDTGLSRPSGAAGGVGNRPTGSTGLGDTGTAGGTSLETGGSVDTSTADDGINDNSGRGLDARQADIPGDAGGLGSADRGDMADEENQPRGNSKPDKVKKKQLLTDAVFEEYKPQKLRIKNAQRHRGVLAESAAMSAIEPPNITYKPVLADSLVQAGDLSDAQLESLTYAGQAHSQMLPDGRRKGFFIGDGTGVGKGREIAGIILDNFNQGRTKAVWVTENDGLLPSARRDWSAMGGIDKDVFEAPKLGEPIKQSKGILFTKYGTVGYGLTVGNDGSVRQQDDKKSRLDQIVSWLGKDYDGVIAFDEAHNMSNSIASKGNRGVKKASLKGLAGIELQKRLPNARIVYVSATGATEVSNLAYAERLGLWGQGTAFADKKDFISKISDGGIAAMELVARDMKAMGLYIARSLSYDDVQYEKMMHTLTNPQRETYDTLAQSWQIVLRNIDAALEATGITDAESGKTLNGMAKGRVIGQFWGAQQRFFNQVLTAMQMPKVLEQVKQDLASGKSIVMQLVNTNAAGQERGINKMEEEEGNLEDVDLSPRDIILQFLDKSFPVFQFEKYVDDDGNERTRQVYDSAGNPVINAEAQAQKDELMAKLSTLRVPDSPIETVLNEFGVANVAEITGRSRRIVENMNEETGRKERVLENRSSLSREADTNAFMDGKKRILIFSNAGGTGRSYHADLTKKNQQPRAHYLIQAGWEATKAVQGFGRTHRTNQASAPVYKLFTTNLKGQMRFVSSIARRLDQLGALTKGQRQTGSQGFFNASDNLEGQLAKDALKMFYRQLAQNYIPGLNRDDVLTKMGLKEKLLDENNTFQSEAAEATEITKFLNRILVLEADLQNKVFDAFQQTLDDLTQVATEQGLVDTGLENLKSDKANIVEESEIRKDESSGSATTYHQVEVGYKAVPLDIRQLIKQEGYAGIYQNERSKAVKVLIERGSKTLSSGQVVGRYTLQGQEKFDWRSIDGAELEKSTYKKIESQDDALAAWHEAMKQMPEYRTETIHMISGTLLPIWDRLPQTRTRVVRVSLDNGDILLGRIIPDNAIDETLRKLGAEKRSQTINMDTLVDQILNDYTVNLVNQWKLVRRKIGGEWRIELLGDELYRHTQNLKSAGVFAEKIAFTTRYFIPTGDEGTTVIQNIVKYTPISEVVAPATAEQQMRNTLRGQQNPNNIGIVPKVFQQRQPVSKSRMNAFESVDPEVEKRLKAATYRPPNAWDKMKQWMETVKRQATREFQYLPKTGQYAKVRFELHRLEKAKQISQDTVIREYLTGITQRLNQEDYELMMRIALLRDLQRDFKRGVALKFGYTEDTLTKDLANLEPILATNPKVQDALSLRDRLFKEKTAQLIDSYRQIGEDISNKFQLENYFRHLVLEYVNGDRAISASKRVVKARTSSGYMAKREASSEADFVVDVLTADAEVLTSMLTDMQTANVLGIIMKDPKINIKNRLKGEAKADNLGQLEALFEAERNSGKYIADRLDKKGNKIGREAFSPLEVDYKTFAKPIAIGMDNLSRLAAQDNLWIGENGEYQKIVASLHKTEQDEFGDDDAGPNVTGFFSYLGALLNSGEAGASSAGMIFKAVQQRKAWVKETINVKTWKDMVPDKFSAFEPSMSQKFYPAQEIDINKISKDIAADVLKNIVSVEQLEPYISTIFKQAESANTMVVPDDLAATLIDLSDTHERSSAYKAIKWSTSILKKNLLFAAPRFVQYEFRNFSSDMEKLFQNKPSAIRYLQRSAFEMYRFVMKDHVAPNENVRDFALMGGMQTLYGVAEIGDLHKLEQFTRFYEKKPHLAIRIWNGYWKLTRRVDTMRETTVRYALYLSLLDDLAKNHGKVTNYMSSNSQEVDALDTHAKKAFLMANDAMIDYSKTSHLGRRGRDTVAPFWSFQEGNLRSNLRWMRNVVHDNGIAYAVGKKLAGKVVFQTPYLALRIGKAALGWSMLAILLAAWNQGLHDDEEKDLPEDVRNQMHIIWGRDTNGKVMYTTSLGAAEDFFKWIGMDDLIPHMLDLAAGRRTFQEVASAMAEKPIDKMAGLVTPLVKNPVEGITGLSFYPHVMNPSGSSGSFDDKMIQMLGLGNEYSAAKKLLSGVPSKPYAWHGLVVTLKDPGESAYYDIKQMAQDFEKRLGKPTGGGGGRISENERSTALYHYKQALKYGDKDTAKGYLKQYILKGGTGQGIDQSLSALDPLHGLSEPDRALFLKSLNADDKAKFKTAMEHYKELLGRKKE